ncbi:hypothetical protein [Streptomyces sp. 891-h]|uniref:hypothetical protein n=1 Tax=Streptomyces sp. 891-h TaxID=2720714 RepID=UPI001FAA4A44|nr:hypothetical protein [Streptomyces sp. 891-h]UNZ16304.1 hypothetical protein HC362_03625 [Streptomyces sp. 891-h]
MSLFSRAVTALVVLCLVSGCAAEADPAESSKHTATGGPTAPVPPPGKEAVSIRVPLDDYDPSPAELEVIDAAEDVLTRACMRRQGLSWKLLPRAAARDAEPRNRRRYGVVEPGIAQVYGYHLPADRPTVARRAVAEAKRRKALDEAEKKAAYGPEGRPGKTTGGCLKKAEERLLEDVPDADFDLLDDTIGATYEQSMKDRSVVRVFRAWSVCMKRAGYHYADPMQALADERWLKGSKVSKAEIRQASTDVRCKKSTDLVPVWNAAENRIQRAAVKKHSAAFTQLRRAQHAWMTAAHQVLDKS